MNTSIATTIQHYTLSSDPRFNVSAKIAPGLVILEAHVDCASGAFQEHAHTKAHYIDVVAADGTVNEAALAPHLDAFVRTVLGQRWNDFPELEARYA